MALNEKQNELFGILFGKRFAEIMKDISREYKEVDYASGVDKPALYAAITKKYAERLVTAKIDAYIETIEKLDIIPDSKDFLPLAKELQEMARKTTNTFKHKMKAPLLRLNETWLETATEHLTNEIDQIVGHAVPRLKYFIDERSLLNSMESSQTSGNNIDGKSSTTFTRDVIYGNQFNLGDNFGGTQKIEGSGNQISQEIFPINLSNDSKRWELGDRLTFVQVMIGLVSLILMIAIAVVAFYQADLRKLLGLP